ncbi:MAG: META domain-containing protein [Paracoccaceae bacterium]|jgi:heat shock protein HslJ|nr:META domain-containing protein [Paracoccaceae bacterium]
MHRLPLAALALLALTACRDESAANPLAALPLGAEWRVTQISGTPVPADVSVTIGRAEEALLTGSSGCNRYNARIEPAGDQLKIGALAGTRMMCAPEVMIVEQAFHSTISRATGARMTGDVLELTQGDKVLITAQQ